MFFEKLKQFLGLGGASSGNDYPPEHTNSKPASGQVFRGNRNVATPDFAKNADASQLPKACRDNLVCDFICRINRHRIYGERSNDISKGSDTFEGITANCDPIKRFGSKIAEEDGYNGGYRYADLNHIYECCCGDPSKCRFYNKAVREKENVAKYQAAS